MAAGHQDNGGKDVQTSTPPPTAAPARRAVERVTVVRRYRRDGGLGTCPGALRTDAVAAGNHQSTVVYWAPGPLPSGLTPPGPGREQHSRDRLDLAPARRRGCTRAPTGQPVPRCAVAPGSGVHLVDAGQTSGYP